MNSNCIASTFSIQRISKHHYLIRGDERIKDYMNFCDVKWSNTYQGWIVNEDDEVDLIQMHMEVMDLSKEQKALADKKKNKAKKTSKKTVKRSDKKSSKKKLIVTSDEDSDDESEDEKPKKKSSKKGDLYERFKRGEDISDDEDDEYVPSSEQTSETITEESESDEESDEDDEDEEDEDECETDPKRKKEFQFYKKGILAFGKMTDRQQDKLEAIWNKTLHGWIIRMSNLEKLKKQGWTEVGYEESQQKQDKKLKEKVIDDSKTVVHTPPVTKKSKIEEEKTFEKHLFSYLVKGMDQTAQLQGIYHPTLKGFLVSLESHNKLLEMGFRDTTKGSNIDKDEKVVVKIDFTQGEQLKA
jgi:hypothetical protein